MISENNIKLLYKGTTNIFNIMNSQKNKKNLILEPLTCLIRISMINFKKEGTKLGISNNSIYFQNPNYLQGILRWSSGDNRDDLHNLHNPIVKSTKWFKTSSLQIKSIYKFSRLGLIKLKLAYNENSIIAHTFDLYISIIEKELQNISKTNKGKKKKENKISENI